MTHKRGADAKIQAGRCNGSADPLVAAYPTCCIGSRYAEKHAKCRLPSVLLMIATCLRVLLGYHHVI